MNLAQLLHQTVQWEARASLDDRDDATYAPAVPLQARSAGQVKDVIGKDGEVTTTVNAVMLLQEVGIGDLLDGREVITIVSMVDVAGNTIGYRAATR